MQRQQDWHTEAYKGLEVHVTALPKDGRDTGWDYTVRITQPGDDSSSEAELTAESGDEADYPSEEAAVEAGFMRGYSMVDAMFQ
ncbi:hypothetical protein [Noviherbaspirillum denitrificans]|uniref:Uncharacterized protein n=1 Tax=Noviherbaspirillum denitrificans TaxID=1968433 RepID=A0A254THR2_9BURK|nr:hypothetical protein [Noviherbaspirillum denitrificans]OWW22144.1 hypothetical protein AYR66_24250 [Noviherbaspirillum denitrificans]